MSETRLGKALPGGGREDAINTIIVKVDIPGNEAES